MKKTVMTVLLISCAATLMIPCFGRTISYTDVEPESWYYDAVETAVNRGYMVGISDRLFAPDKAVRRAEAVQVFYAMARKPSTEEAPALSDVPKDAWYADAVCFAVEHKIAAGYPDHTFRPEREITREDFVTMLYAFAEYEQEDRSVTTNLEAFSDQGEVSNYAFLAMCWAVSHHLIAGTDGGRLEPRNSITRAQTAVILDAYRFFLRQPEYLDANDPALFSELMDEALWADGERAGKLAGQLEVLRAADPVVFARELAKKNDETKQAVVKLLEIKNG